MIFEFKNLGSIKEAQIEMGNLTVICGKNNTGKTYLTYAVWGMLARVLTVTIFNSNSFPNLNKTEIAATLNQGLSYEFDLSLSEDNIKADFSGSISGKSKQLHEVFNANPMFFEKATIEVIQSSVIIDYSHKISFSLIVGQNLRLKCLKEINSSIVKISLVRLEQTNDTISVNESNIETLFLFILSMLLYRPIILLTAQRDSISLLYKVLDKNNSDLIKNLLETKNIKLLEDNISNFAMPINENITFSRDLTSRVTKTNSFLQEEHPELLKEIETILGVNFIVGNDSVSIKDNKTETIIPDYMASTSVRSLLYLHFWLKHQAQKGDLLMIDEPELNLHPENQIKMARLFAKLVNVGIKVWITTHSDYIIKEFNNLIMLGNVSNREEMLSKFKNEKGENEYSENDILKAEDLKAYIAYNLPDGSGATVKKIAVDKYGMVESTFDDTIDRMNDISRTFAEHIQD